MVKHGRLSSEYDRVRKAAGLAKPRYDFPDDVTTRTAEPLVDDDFRERMVVLGEIEATQKAEAKKKADDNTARANAMVMLREYQSYGVEPPHVLPNGCPKFSIGFLFRIGWSIAEFNGKKTMVSPIAAKGK